MTEEDVLVVIDDTGVHMGLPEDELPLSRKLLVYKYAAIAFSPAFCLHSVCRS